MRLPIILFGFISLGFILFAAPSSKILLGDFVPGWEKNWETKLLYKRSNQFRVVTEDRNKVLRVDSSRSASGMFREIKQKPIVPGRISWRWKVKSSLESNTKERTKSGDDYAARLFLLFEPRIFRWRIPTVCYVWAGREKAGSIFKSAYSNNVCMIVLESGNQKAGTWIQEQREYIEDYKTCFERSPEELSAAAIMVDTDDTGTQATAWFDDLILITE
jgi:Protein of unknown function (DUF3047)